MIVAGEDAERGASSIEASVLPCSRCLGFSTASGFAYLDTGIIINLDGALSGSDSVVPNLCAMKGSEYGTQE